MPNHPLLSTFLTALVVSAASFGAWGQDQADDQDQVPWRNWGNAENLLSDSRDSVKVLDKNHEHQRRVQIVFRRVTADYNLVPFSPDEIVIDFDHRRIISKTPLKGGQTGIEVGIGKKEADNQLIYKRLYKLGAFSEKEYHSATFAITKELIKKGGRVELLLDDLPVHEKSARGDQSKTSDARLDRPSSLIFDTVKPYMSTVFYQHQNAYLEIIFRQLQPGGRLLPYSHDANVDVEDVTSKGRSGGAGRVPSPHTAIRIPTTHAPKDKSKNLFGPNIFGHKYRFTTVPWKRKVKVVKRKINDEGERYGLVTYQSRRGTGVETLGVEAVHFTVPMNLKKGSGTRLELLISRAAKKGRKTECSKETPSE